MSGVATLDDAIETRLVVGIDLLLHAEPTAAVEHTRGPRRRGGAVDGARPSRALLRRTGAK
jgi:hypothetical protein